jgi:hypothetical protein
MKVKIQYKQDFSEIPFCAYCIFKEEYVCQWSKVSYADARESLLMRISKQRPPLPPDEEVEI